MCLPWNHKWEVFERTTFKITYKNIDTSVDGIMYSLKCARCGNITSKSINAFIENLR